MRAVPRPGAREQVTRLLALVPYLQAREVSLRELARDFGVTPAQAVRDLRVLWMCGLPGLGPGDLIDIDFEAFEDDPDGIVRLDNAEYLDRPLTLGRTEAAALVVALRTLREAAAPETAAIIDRALAKDNAQRYQTGAEMAADLRACMGLSTGGGAPSPQVDFNL